MGCDIITITYDYVANGEPCGQSGRLKFVISVYLSLVFDSARVYLSS